MRHSYQSFNKWAAKQFLFTIGQRKKIWRKLAKLQDNGVPIIKALETIYDRRRRTHNDRDPSLIALKDWLLRMRNGQRLSSAVYDWVSQQERVLIASGENSGQLSQAFNLIISLLDSNKKIRHAILGGITYPLILLSATFFIAYVFSVKVFPSFYQLADKDKWQGFASYVIGFTDFVAQWAIPLAIGVVGLVLLILYIMPYWDGSFRVKLDRFIPFSLYRISVGSSWLLAMAAMIRSGRRLEDAVIETGKGAKPWLKNRVDKCLRQMRQGYNLGESLVRTKTEFPDREILDDLVLYSSLSNVDEALSILGNEWMDESVENIRQKSGVLFAIGVVIAALVLGALIGGLISMELQIQGIIHS